MSIKLVGIDQNGGKINKDKVQNEKIDEINFEKIKGDPPKVRLYIKKENKIIELSLEDYVIGVLAAEMPVSFEKEALKAQAVAARTYALSHMEAYGGQPYNEKIGADLYDGVECQVYMTKEERIEAWQEDKANKYWDKLTQVIKETSGQVLTYKGELVENPYYFATSSGNTEDSVVVFNQDIPYLKSVESPGEEIAPKFISKVNVRIEDAAKKINEVYPNAKVTSSKLMKQISILDKTETGYVVKMKIGNITITGAKFRSLFNLNSSNFTITSIPGNLLIQCHGYGHGVGMSQWGANVMAKDGNDYISILKHYYNDIEISKIK